MPSAFYIFVPVQTVKNLPAEIIADGNVVDKNLKEFDLDKFWLNTEITSQGYSNAEDIFYAELNSDGRLYIIPGYEEKDKPIH